MKLRSIVLAMTVAATGPLACSDGDDGAPPRETRSSTPATKTFTGRVNGTGGSGLRVRKDATTDSEQLTTLAEGATVTISCRKRGEIIEGNADWNFLADKNGYASDTFIVVDGNEADIPRCDAGDQPSLPPASPTGGPVDIEGPDVQPHVQAFIDEACGAVAACRASTYVGHQPQADLALDIPSGEGYGKLPTDGHAFGDRVAEWAIANRTKHRIEYVIYRQRINFGEGWEAMEDRGSITQNHFDHVHVSFLP
jgi:hypothetical protein